MNEERTNDATVNHASDLAIRSGEHRRGSRGEQPGRYRRGSRHEQPGRNRRLEVVREPSGTRHLVFRLGSLTLVLSTRNHFPRFVVSGPASETRRTFDFCYGSVSWGRR